MKAISKIIVEVHTINPNLGVNITVLIMTIIVDYGIMPKEKPQSADWGFFILS